MIGGWMRVWLVCLLWWGVAAGGAGAAPVTCSGANDDQAVQTAINQAPVGGLVQIGAGPCVFAQTVVITKPVTITGVGIGTQIVGNGAFSVFSLQLVDAVTMRDLFVGSLSNATGVALIELKRANHGEFHNITMLGGYYGVHLVGSLDNTFIDLRTARNFSSVIPGSFPTNQYWVFTQRYVDLDGMADVASNANTFIAPVLEGGTNGFHVQDEPGSACAGKSCVRGGEGSAQIFGGTLEGMWNGVALMFDRTLHASVVSGVHFECNATDVLVSDAANIHLTGLYSQGAPNNPAKQDCSLPATPAGGIHVTGTQNGRFSGNVSLVDSIAQKVTLDSAVRRVVLSNVMTDLNCVSADNGNLLPFIDPPGPRDATIRYENVGHNCP
jgi:hypothetical protein